ncbi:hypothetical protein [Labrys wisconsinensis]|uniref:Uncharacterized protein n=1 Tax=Labrys wisconsinensis TaxID=425677 RepID=A0ABU0IYK6_9HYPH|nr:hypothetical protein [Labrys wisconsinensis]MDQ0467103.1 hypothetical protein [Labrys wisconsinensis]
MLIVLSACLIASPATCREERINWSMEDATPMRCLMLSQETLAQWKESHPRWQIARWSCVPRDRVTNAI